MRRAALKDRFGHRISPRLLAAYVEGDVTPSEATAMERALKDSPELRRRADDLRHIKDVLSSDVQALKGVDLTSAIKSALNSERRRSDQAAEPGRPRWSRRTLAGGAIGFFACASLASLFVSGAFRHPPADEFRVKSAAPAADQQRQARTVAGGALETAADRWAGIVAYRVGGDGAPQRLGARLPAGDGLLFSYTNVGGAPFGYLMIFGIDARGEVRWFFPAYEREGTNPSSISIVKGNANVSLNELLHQDLVDGPLALHALFSRVPLRVVEVEAWFKKRPATAALPWRDAHQQIIVTTVER